MPCQSGRWVRAERACILAQNLFFEASDNFSTNVPSSTVMKGAINSMAVGIGKGFGVLLGSLAGGFPRLGHGVGSLGI